MTSSNVIIEGNSIDNGIYDSGVYAYDALIDSAAKSSIVNNNLSATSSSYLDLTDDCVVNGNFFTAPAASATFISLEGNSCIITNNIFARAAVSITAYIAISSSSGHQINNNNFDSTTVNGTSETTISGITAGDVIDKNKNHIKYAVVPMGVDHPASNFATVNSIAYYNAIHEITNKAVYSYYANTSFIIGSTGGRDFSFYAAMDKHLPRGAQIMSIKAGVWFAGTATITTNAGSNLVEIIAKSQPIVSANYSAGTGSILDPKLRANTFIDSQSASYSFDLDTTLSVISAGTQYVTLNVSSNDNYVVGQDNTVIVKFHINALLASGSGEFEISPMVVKYTV